MPTILGIESTAHTFGIGIVRDGKVLANVRDMYTTKSGGIIPIAAAKHHREVASRIYEEALKKAKIKETDIDAVAFSNAPGLAPCLVEGMKFAKTLVKRLNENHHSRKAPLTRRPKLPSLQSRSELTGSETAFGQVSSLTKNLKAKNLTKSILSQENNRAQLGKLNKKQIPLIPVNHCVAHLEIGKSVGAHDPVMLYASGANTQIISYEAGKYRIFGETLDLGVGNFIDTVARFMHLGFPGGPKIEKLAKKSKNYVELPYSVKGMDITLSGIQTNIKQKLTKGIKKEDLCFSMQETVFAMLVEVAERALAHVGKKELLLAGGVACNARLQAMCKVMCKERGAKLFVPSRDLLVDNGSMIAYLGEIISNRGFQKNPNKIDIAPRERTDDVSVFWK